jgi:hypothetical protein
MVLISIVLYVISTVWDTTDTGAATVATQTPLIHAVLRSWNYLFRLQLQLQLQLQLSKSFRSGSGDGSNLSFVGSCFHSF